MFITIFTFFISINLFNIYYCIEDNIIRLKNLQIDNSNKTISDSFNISFKFGDCSVVKCGDNLLCGISGGQCLNFPINNTYECNCQDGFITHSQEKLYECCYKQKSAMTALLLEFLIGFGVGHFYLENFVLGVVKLSIYSLFCFTNCFIIFKMLKSPDKKGSIFNLGKIICFLLCSCIYIGWQIIDCILISLGGLNDGNDAPLY